MKVGTILTACDLNPLYSDFIPNFIKAWTILFPSADVIVVLIADEIPDSLEPYIKSLRLFKPVSGIHTAFQAQCIRLLYPRQIERNEGVLITDMDMLPMNRSYYMDSIKDISDDTFITYRQPCRIWNLPMCYNIACPSVWQNMFGDSTIESILQTWYETSNYDGQHGGSGWGTDQKVLIDKFNSWGGPRCMLDDTKTKFNRLDRIHPRIFNDLAQLAKSIKDGIYSDYHCLRPYSQYKDINDFLVSCLR